MNGFITPLLLLGLASTALAEGAPDFTAERLTGGKFRLSKALADGPVLIHFWDACCSGCREALPTVEKVGQAFKGKITVVAISTDSPKSQSKVKPLVKGNGYRFDVLLDPNMEVRRLFGGTESPLTILVAPSGEIILRRVGATQDDEAALTKAIAQLLENSSPPSSDAKETQ